MTEIFEVQGFKEDLINVKAEIDYEAATRPGEGPEVEKLFLSASEKIAEAIGMLEQAEKLIEASFDA